MGLDGLSAGIPSRHRPLCDDDAISKDWRQTSINGNPTAGAVAGAVAAAN